ncbi:HNH endonuclease [Pseudomonas kulmbachensis]|uniref:HNH endonuclease n=1 Tax=Pseudomonas kulmbachensis TaxID=3043408 RepID=UPI002AB2CB57|nr:HNH endonuclease signature motif containing protein [Pseudomonas sp. V3/3/4/13]
MTAWIFQGNPATFDMEGYLESSPGALTWLVKQYTKDIRSGDTVFLWRSKGRGDSAGAAGVVASAEVISNVLLIHGEPESEQYWLDKTRNTEQLRVWLKISRVAKSKQVLKRDWLLEEPYLKNMHILKQPAGTNFKLTSAEEDRLHKMWLRVGQDWSRDESIAGLWAYNETYGGKISQLLDSPVGRVSDLTGRAVGCVYNRIMNFRNIDPRGERQGMFGAGQTDRTVCQEFFDIEKQVLNEKKIKTEFSRVWGAIPEKTANSLVDGAAESQAFGAEVERLISCSLEKLITAYNQQSKQSIAVDGSKPQIRVGRTTLYDRNPLVVAIAKVRASNTCEIPTCTNDSFISLSCSPYCETHHIVPLSQGGVDEIENVVCLCPAHHREAHYGKKAQELRSLFHEIRSVSMIIIT